MRDVVHLLDQFPVTEDAIGRHISADIDDFSELRQHRITHVRDRQKRTGLRVALAIEQELVSPRLRQDADIGLHETIGQSRRVIRVPAPANAATLGLRRRPRPWRTTFGFVERHQERPLSIDTRSLPTWSCRCAARSGYSSPCTPM